MVVQVEIDSNCKEPMIVVRASEMSLEIESLVESIKALNNKPILAFFKEEKEYFISLNDILFFETEEHFVLGHLKNDVYKVKLRLYELEQILPKNFVRVSKSTILNMNPIASIDHTLVSSNLVQFYKSHKQVYVSRFYYKNLRTKLSERRSL